MEYKGAAVFLFYYNTTLSPPQVQRQSDMIKRLQDALAQSQSDLDQSRHRADTDVSTAVLGSALTQI